VIAADEGYISSVVSLHRSRDRRWISEPQFACLKVVKTKEDTQDVSWNALGWSISDSNIRRHHFRGVAARDSEHSIDVQRCHAFLLEPSVDIGLKLSLGGQDDDLGLTWQHGDLGRVVLTMLFRETSMKPCVRSKIFKSSAKAVFSLSR